MSELTLTQGAVVCRVRVAPRRLVVQCPVLLDVRLTSCSRQTDEFGRWVEGGCLELAMHDPALLVRTLEVRDIIYGYILRETIYIEYLVYRYIWYSYDMILNKISLTFYALRTLPFFFITQKQTQLKHIFTYRRNSADRIRIPAGRGMSIGAGFSYSKEGDAMRGLHN